MTNFRLFETENLKFDENALQKVRKHCRKKKKCLLQAISLLPSVFKRLVLQTHKKPGLV